VVDTQLVFMYREQSEGTRRWLVDEGGVIVESAWFPDHWGLEREDRVPDTH
jgi:hypothetical protein